MCKTCGCDDDAKVTVTNLQTGNEERMERSAPVTPPNHAHDHHHDHIITMVMSHMITIMRTTIMIIPMHPSPRLSPRSPVSIR